MVTFRVGTHADADACSIVHRRAWKGMTFVPQDLHTEEEDLAWMRNDVFGRQVVLLAETEGRIVAFLSIAGDLINNLYVMPGYQGRGIGSQLIDIAKAASAGYLRLWVFEPNTGAIRFYERHGFVTIERTDGRTNMEKVPDRQMAWRRPS